MSDILQTDCDQQDSTSQHDCDHQYERNALAGGVDHLPSGASSAADRTERLAKCWLRFDRSWPNMREHFEEIR